MNLNWSVQHDLQIVEKAKSSHIKASFVNIEDAFEYVTSKSNYLPSLPKHPVYYVDRNFNIILGYIDNPINNTTKCYSKIAAETFINYQNPWCLCFNKSSNELSINRQYNIPIYCKSILRLEGVSILKVQIDTGYIIQGYNDKYPFVIYGLSEVDAVLWYLNKKIEL